MLFNSLVFIRQITPFSGHRVVRAKSFSLKVLTQLTFIYLKSTKETLENGVKYVQS